MNKNIIFCLIWVSVFFGNCSGVSEFSNEDAKRHTWLINFLQGYTIRDGHHDYDNGTLEFYLEIDSIDTFYLKSDSIAISEDWKINIFNPNFRVYSKEMKTAGNLAYVLVIKMEYITPNILKVKVD